MRPEILDIVEQSRAAFKAEIDRLRWAYEARQAWVEAMPKWAAWHRRRAWRYERRFGRVKRKPHRLSDCDWGHFDWLELDPSGKPVSNVNNAVQILAHHPLLSGIIGRDLVTGEVMLKGPLPYDFWESLSFTMRKITFDDVTGIQIVLQKLGLVTLGRDEVMAAIKRIARENAWQPGEEQP
jgi:hypothetical protein